jgi:hypothetical protein
MVFNGLGGVDTTNGHTHPGHIIINIINKRPPNNNVPNHSEIFYYRSLEATVVPTGNGPAFFRLFFISKFSYF